MANEDLTQYLLPTSLIDSDHPSVKELAYNLAGHITSPSEKAVRIIHNLIPHPVG
jgi:hypothetical protein